MEKIIKSVDKCLIKGSRDYMELTFRVIQHDGKEFYIRRVIRNGMVDFDVYDEFPDKLKDGQSLVYYPSGLDNIPGTIAKCARGFLREYYDFTDEEAVFEGVGNDKMLEKFFADHTELKLSCSPYVYPSMEVYDALGCPKSIELLSEETVVKGTGLRKWVYSYENTNGQHFTIEFKNGVNDNYTLKYTKVEDMEEELKVERFE